MSTKHIPAFQLHPSSIPALPPHLLTPSVASLAAGAGVSWILGAVQVGLVCNVQHPPGQGMALCHSRPSAAESVSHSSFQSFPSLPVHSWALPLPWTFSMLGCGIAAQHKAGRACWVPPLPSPHSSCCVLWEEGDWELEHILGTLITPQSPQSLGWAWRGPCPSSPPSLSPPGGFLKVWWR